MTGSRYIIKELATVSIACFLAATGAEVYLRAFNPQQLMSPAYEERYGMLVFKPGFRIKHWTPYYDVVYHINSLGFRGKDYSEAKPTGAYRIVSMGPSFSFGQGVNDGETYCAILEQKLNSTAFSRRYEVLNMAMGGESVGFYEYLYRTIARRFKPNLLLVYLFFPSPQILTDDLAAIRHNLPSASMENTRAARIRRLVRNLPGYTFLCEHSHLWARTRLSLAQKIQDDVTALPDANSAGQAARFDDLQRNYTKSMNILIDEACLDGTKVLIFKERSYLEPFPIINTYLREKARSGPCLQILEFDIGPQYSYPKEGHWNPAGQRFVAEKLFEFLKPRFPHAVL